MLKSLTLLHTTNKQMANLNRFHIFICVYYSNFERPLVLALGDCIPVRPWSDSPITCLAELRMVWRDKNESSILTGLRLYFLPENTPIGRNCHGEVSDYLIHKWMHSIAPSMMSFWWMNSFEGCHCHQMFAFLICSGWNVIDGHMCSN